MHEMSESDEISADERVSLFRDTDGIICGLNYVLGIDCHWNWLLGQWTKKGYAKIFRYFPVLTLQSHHKCDQCWF